MSYATTPSAEAFAFGKAAALSAECADDLREWSAAYPELFSAKVFDKVCVMVANANAFGAPWHTARELRTACRSALWIFPLDRLVDHVANSPDQVAAIVAECRAVADGAEPDTPLGRMLADLRASLSEAPAFADGFAAWRAELVRMLEAMAREWEWKTALKASGGATAPTVEQYLDNAANFGSTWVNVAHWIATGEIAELDALRRASDAVQRALRLANDLRTYRRDVDWVDLNVLMLGVDRAAVTARIDALRGEVEDLLRPLETSRPRQVDYLRRQLDYSLAFYGGGGDYWA